MSVISAYGAFRLVVVLLAIWSFIEGFSLFTGSFDALTLGGHDRTAERIIGAQMIVLVPVYALLVWRRDRYRLLIWVPYVAQLAIILPIAWSALQGDTDGLLLMLVSVIFFALMFYFWWQSHPLDFFQPAAAEDETGEEDDLDEDAEDGGDEEEPGPGNRDAASRRRYRRLRPK